ncbi:ABC transporter permease [Salirhabdus salicampi]|uniref:ABC transporter permease n=1 Tax=Salirhabdus salicampi TaxID=476102 RepID=UPI0020C558AA|nr:ABC transporter permease [Salirhabdus salicampi]MCP8618141.1 ABC transporter permease [Salirhabdus salicampi]
MELILDYIEFWQERYSSIMEYTMQHLTISFVSVILGALLAIPLGVYLTKIRTKAIRNVIFNTANVFQTVPTIALLAIMIPVLGIGMKPAIFALFLYSLLPLLRNTYAGIESVDPDVIEAARGMGFNTFQRLFQIEIPLAFPYIMSGLRITTVYIISWTTIAAVIGAGGLGGLIIAGLGFNDKFLIFTGTIMAVLMALLAEFLMGKLEKAVAYK